MHLLAYNPDLPRALAKVPELEIARCERYTTDTWPQCLTTLPNPGNTSPPCHGSGTRANLPNGGGYWANGKFYSIRLHLNDQHNNHIYVKEPVERHRCFGRNTDGSDCRAWSRVSQREDGTFFSEGYCKVHIRGRVVKLGQVTPLYTQLGGSLQKHIEQVLTNPDAQTLSQETALMKTLLNKVLELINGKPDAWQSLADAAAVLSVTERVAKVAKTAAEVDALRENHLSYKQVLVILSAAIEWCLRRFGKSDNAKDLLLTMLGDLPWPTGVARVSGSEGLIGKRGELILPARPSEKPADSIEVEWGVLETKYKQGSEQQVRAVQARDMNQEQTRESHEHDAGLRGDQFAPAVFIEHVLGK